MAPSPSLQRLGVWRLLGIAVVLGLGIAWVDSRPTWDDAGITAAAIFSATALLGLTLPRYAWLWALAVGGWIPVLGITLHRNYGAALALLVAFVGAYAGAIARQVLAPPIQNSQRR